mmetsp:Transcript_68778/g.138269  ORF Transcript_68778/g.138269 Transcript_68778/m.138269 type:complete len:187 (-) Transcript_68778:186-746(-)|eukprot:CAMPEP_0171606594 /NCGR_PEP_ID=MMETSP0990-20121206/7850_1 /TAXON_ID=483369 /ORGANISM="non described non described, Strain CCMP2098" /LENGTH=186 /DNA_ID=CAMNT_0012169449 /DNA_START=56 /DNA_END=616 /DNA_ORIENTATION=-
MSRLVNPRTRQTRDTKTDDDAPGRSVMFYRHGDGLSPDSVEGVVDNFREACMFASESKLTGGTSGCCFRDLGLTRTGMGGKKYGGGFWLTNDGGASTFVMGWALDPDELSNMEQAGRNVLLELEFKASQDHAEKGTKPPSSNATSLNVSADRPGLVYVKFGEGTSADRQPHERRKHHNQIWRNNAE